MYTYLFFEYVCLCACAYCEYMLSLNNGWTLGIGAVAFLPLWVLLDSATQNIRDLQMAVINTLITDTYVLFSW